MRARLPSLLAVLLAVGCARTEVLDSPQGALGSTTATATATATASATASGTANGASTSAASTTRGSTAAGTTTTGGTAAATVSGTGSGSGTASTLGTSTTGGPSASSTSGGTLGTSGTSGGGGECAPCQGSGDCALGGVCIPDRSGATFCTAPCSAPGPTCADPGSVCIPVGPGGVLGCFPQTFSCGPGTTTTGTSASTSTSTTGPLSVGVSSGSGGSGGAVSTGSGVVASSSGGATSFTSTTGGFSTSASGGTSGGGSDCRTLGCPAGEACNAFPGSAGPYFTCTCSVATSSAPSSCAGNPGGLSVCDQNTLQCRLPRDYERCNRGPGAPACQSGDVCIFGFCIQPCTTTADCSATFTHCVNRVGQGYCELDRCGPNTSNGDYYQPCQVETPGDGFCQPFADANGQVTGYCLANGPTPTGAPCPGFGIDKPAQCQSGDLCFAVGSPPPDGGTAARCYATCNANSGAGYPRACSNGSACFTNGQPTSVPDPGICYP